MIPTDGRSYTSSSASSSTSHLLTPSIVAYTTSETNDNNDKIYVGREAQAYLTTSPKNTIYNSKRLIGRKYTDVNGDTTLSSMPHQFGLLNQTDKDSNAGFILDNGKIISPVEVASKIISTLVNAADTFLGHSNARKVIIAVPAQFNTVQREATALAFTNAGLKVVNMLEEPTAAAIAYGLQNQPHVHNVLVYDFGGGTLDVSLLWMHVGSVQVIGTDGDTNLGGSDFDKCMVELLHQKGRLDNCDMSHLRKIAEQVKRKLSTSTSTIASCGDGIRLSSFQKYKVERSHFEEQCGPLFSKSLEPVTRLLQDQNMLKEDIDEVVLVGGTTRIPKIRNMLKHYFNGRSPKFDIDPDLAVAYGAAMFSA
jgi:endoplasmic reticulum chaperone BiP